MKVGPYEVLGELGRGGMGVVFRVRSEDGRESALKLLLHSSASSLARFERERRLLSSLGEEHGFVGLLDLGSSSSGAWLVMPLVPGGTLGGRLQAGPLGVEETIALGIQLAAALGAAHERGIVHRDVKPENVLFTAAGRAGSPPPRPLIADLGLAKHFLRATPDSISLSKTGELRGTAGYMAPEQTSDAKAVGPPADIFALGAILYECLAGRPAFSGESAIAVFAKLGAGRVEPIGRPDVPPWLEAIVMKALANDPRARFASGASLAQALRARGASRARRTRWAALAAGVAVGGLGLAVTLALRDGPKGLSTERPVTRAHEQRDPRDRDGTIADSTRAIELDPRDAKAWASRAHARAGKGDFDGAFADATRAIELDPRNARAWTDRGYARSRKGDWDGIIADETRAIELDPGIAMAWVNRGYARAAKGDLDGAIADETRAIELDPKDAAAWANRGGPRAKKGDLDGAIADETRAIELDPGEKTAWANRGSSRGDKGDLDGAIADFTKAIELAPRHVGSWLNRAAARSKKGDRDGAIADETKAIELDPSSAVAWFDRGYERDRTHDWAGAIADTTRAIELDPKVAGPWFARGVARAGTGDTDGAISDLEQSLGLDPKSVYAASARRKLDALKARR